MNNEIYNLIDTAIKIGLGALIASLSNFLLTRFNHKSDAKKEIYKRRLDSVERISDAAEDYFQKWSHFVNLTSGVSRVTVEKGINANKEQYEKIRERDSALVEARNNKMTAISRLKLLGINDVANILEETGIIEKELRDIIVFEKKIPSVKQLVLIQEKMKTKRDYFYNTLNKHYNANKFTCT